MYIFWPQIQLSSVYSKNKGIDLAVQIILEGTLGPSAEELQPPQMRLHLPNIYSVPQALWHKIATKARRFTQDGR